MAAQGQAVVQDCDLSYLSSYVPGIDAGMAPYLIQEPEQVVKLWKSDVGQEWCDALAEKGLHLVDLHYFGTRNLIADTEVHSRADMSNLKIRCAATPMWNEVVRVLGGNATNTAWSETYQALSQGVADAAESPSPLLYSARLYEPCKYLIKTEHLVAATAIVMSEEVYQSLSPEAQEAIDSCADIFADEVVDKVLANEQEYDQMENVLRQFKEGKEKIWLKRMGRDDTALWYEEKDFSGIDVVVLEWTHGNSGLFEGVDIPILLASTPDTAFITMVIELEQQKLEARAQYAKLIVSKSCELLTYDEYKQRMAAGR